MVPSQMVVSSQPAGRFWRPVGASARCGLSPIAAPLRSIPTGMTWMLNRDASVACCKGNAQCQASHSARDVEHILVRAAKPGVSTTSSRSEASREHRERLAARFFAAAEEGDLKGLESLLAAGVALHGDGGCKVPSIARPLHGRCRVARTLLAWDAGSGALQERQLAPRGGERPARRNRARSRRQADRRDGARRRWRPDPGRQLARQPPVGRAARSQRSQPPPPARWSVMSCRHDVPLSAMAAASF